MTEIYTDGACSGNPGRGGWAAIVFQNGSKRTLRGSEARTTNNRMELVAVIKGLQSVPEASEVTVFTDSLYVVNTMTQNWRRNANKDIWALLDAEVGKRTVKWEWVRGHTGHTLNEEANDVAMREAGTRTGPPVSSLAHTDESGNARMVDVSSKPDTERVAVAVGSVLMRRETMKLIQDNALKKGDVMGVARVAGIMAAKNTSQLVPLCHPIPLDHISVEFQLDDQRNAVDVTATAKTTSKTGVEMEALTAVSVAALTIYDMCKSADRGMRIEGVRLVRKSGGRSGEVVLEA